MCVCRPRVSFSTYVGSSADNASTSRPIRPRYASNSGTSRRWTQPEHDLTCRAPTRLGWPWTFRCSVKLALKFVRLGSYGASFGRCISYDCYPYTPRLTAPQRIERMENLPLLETYVHISRAQNCGVRRESIRIANQRRCGRGHKRRMGHRGVHRSPSAGGPHSPHNANE